MAKTFTILITGTRKGIGRHLVNYYRKKNYRVIGCSRGAVDYEFENYEHYKLDVTNIAHSFLVETLKRTDAKIWMEYL